MFTGKTVTGEISSEMAEWLAGRSVKGSVHSVFSKAVNIVAAGQMISILSAEALLEPMSVRLTEKIVFTDIGIKAGDEMYLSTDKLILGTLCMPIELHECWKEKYTIRLVHLSEHAERADRFVTDYLRNFARPVGMAILFQETDNTDKKAYLTEKVQTLMSACGEEETLDAMKGLIGLGPGLTPAGDDFLCGFMRTCMLFETQIHYAKLIDQIKHLTNELSAKSLELAAKGRCADEISMLLFELFDADGNYIKAISHMNAVASYGSSSGTDIICGICMAIKKELSQSSEQPKSI